MLRAYRRDPYDDLVGEWLLRNVTLSELQGLFGQTDEMYDCYPVQSSQAELSDEPPESSSI